MPDAQHLLLLAGSGLLLSLGHFFIFLSYRTGATAAVAPFYYIFAIWAVCIGLRSCSARCPMRWRLPASR